MIDPFAVHIDLSEPEETTRPRRKLLQRIDGTNDFVLAFDYSTLSDFLACDRRGENKMVYAREARKPTTALEFGGLFHRCEELRMRHGLTTAVKDRQRELVMEHYVQNPVPPDEYRNAEMMFALLRKYNEYYEHDGWPKAVMQGPTGPVVEVPFRLPLCSIEVNARLAYSVAELVEDEDLDGEKDLVYVSTLHFQYIGKIDAGLQQYNLTWVVDTKTTSRGGAEFQDAFALSLQTRGYAWALWKIFGVLPAGMILNGIICRKPSKTGNSIEFVRPSYIYSPESLLEFQRDVSEHCSTISHCLQTGVWPQRASSFRSPCSWCDYFDNCQQSEKLRIDDLKSSLYRDVTWSPLHSE